MVEQTQAPPPTVPESADVNAERVMSIAVALAGTVIGCAIVVFGLLTWFARNVSQPAGPYSDAGTVQTFAAPRLEATPARDILIFKREKAQKLEHYDWIDRSRGIVHIPIERAMELMVQRGEGASDDERP